MMNALVVTLFGAVQVSPPGPAAPRAAPLKQAAPKKPARKVAELLGYLLCGGRRSYERTELADHFWSHQGSDRARRCLSTAVWRLRQILEPKGVRHGTYLCLNGPDTLGFNWASKHHVDVIDMEMALDRALAILPQRMSREEVHQLEAGLALYAGDFLSGAQDFWVLRERDRLSARYLDGLSHLMRYKLHTGQYQAGLSLGLRILERDPLREDVHRDMMRLNVRTGQRSRAIRQYQECRAHLQRELQIDPAPETEEAYAALCQGGVPDLEPDQGTVSPQMAEQALKRLCRALEEVDRARAMFERLSR
ncbi:AfsR/SARP family transcriptional regulator [Ruegeria hyattellae]|uniref:AfsR/SARP family transcriptional regulator n=1 Tax=Ruegeria hyattellae TaxID=3233337 RepID=UPI00355C3B05